MKDKNYGLTNQPGAGKTDKMPDWMNSIPNIIESKKSEKQKEHPFAGINDPILNPNRIGLDKK